MTNFADLLTWVADLAGATTSTFTAVSSMWPIYVPLGLGVFGAIFGKVRGVLWGKKGRSKRGG